ncbi:MAG: hypothetical protein IPK72_17730 [Candidatus Eisenbacteria bacterium]|nr:hypothetical protein [Candidatus Eisenbacteria bacterium]
MLGAQHGAWLSTWEVLEVEPGTSILLRDLLTGEERKVLERTASRSLERRHAILARVIDHRGISVLGGLHPSALAPTDAEAVAGRVRTRLRRKGNVPVERLRVEAIGRYLITCWEEAQQAAVERALRRPELRNTDGDPFLITTDHFAFDPGDRAEIQRRLAAMPEVTDSPAADDPEQNYVFTRASDAARTGLERTVIGRVELRGTKLRVETNSLRRADTVRSLLEGSLGSLARHRGREHVDANVAVAAHREASPPEREIAPATELDRMTRETKARLYADWADHPLPALAGKSARESVKTKAGRKEVDLLLREMELMESGTPAAQRFDFGVIRKQLGLE